MSVYTYQTMLLRKFYKFIKFKTVSKMFAANSPYVGPDSTRRAKFECGFQHWTIMSSNLTKSQSHNALASLVHAMVKKQCYRYSPENHDNFDHVRSIVFSFYSMYSLVLFPL